MRATPELQLILDCIRVGEQPSTSRLAESAAAVQDWTRFIWLADEHRVLPMVCERLAQNPGVPDKIRRTLAERHAQITFWNLHQTKVLSDCIAVLESAGIPVIAFKGPVLAQKLYGGVGQRQFRDLDILVPRERASEAVSILEGQGFAWSNRVPHHLFDEYLRSRKDIELESPDGVVVEVHWDLMGPRFRESKRTDWAWNSCVPGRLMGRNVSLLAAPDEVSFLVLHGSKHYFKRLSWLLDIAKLLDAEPELRARLQADADGRFRRRHDLSLRLAAELLGLPDVPLADARTERLVAQVRGWIFTEQSFDIGVARARGYQARCFDRRAQGLRYYAGAALTPSLADQPSRRLLGLSPLRYVTRPLRLAYGQSRRALAARLR